MRAGCLIASNFENSLSVEEFVDSNWADQLLASKFGACRCRCTDLGPVSGERMATGGRYADELRPPEAWSRDSDGNPASGGSQSSSAGMQTHTVWHKPHTSSSRRSAAHRRLASQCLLSLGHYVVLLPGCHVLRPADGTAIAKCDIGLSYRERRQSDQIAKYSYSSQPLRR